MPKTRKRKNIPLSSILVLILLVIIVYEVGINSSGLQFIPGEGGGGGGTGTKPSLVRYVGLATRFSSTTHTVANYQAVKAKMDQYHLTVIRLGSGDDLWTSTYTWNGGSAVDWFLRNTNFLVIVDRHHTIGLTYLNQTSWNKIDSNLASMSTRWVAYGDRVILEPVNEYANTDFKAQMNRIILTFRNAGHTNWLVFNWNLWGASWSSQATLTDTYNRIYVGYHYYMNKWTGTSSFNNLNSGHSITGLPMFGSEEGSDEMEKGNFTTTKVAYMTQYLKASYDAGYSNVVWMNHELDNMARYESLGLVFPTT